VYKKVRELLMYAKHVRILMPLRSHLSKESMIKEHMTRMYLWSVMMKQKWKHFMMWQQN